MKKYLVKMVMGVAAAAAIAACGGSDESIFGPNGGPGGESPTGPPGSFTDGNGAPVGTSSACVTSTASAALTPVNLVVMYDKSGSMGDPADGFDPAKRWIPVGTGMKSFLSDTGSRSMRASLQFFPLGGDLQSTCNAAYGTPRVPMSPLTDAGPFVSAIDATTPNGGTPTLPALTGAISYARSVASANPEQKTVVVLVTDGEPGYRVNGQNVPGCPDNDIAHVASAAQGALAGNPSIATYVIGVGPSLQNLNSIAAAGGTGQALMVPVNDPGQTTASFQSALEKIRSATLSCVFGMPKAPDGQQLDADRVNVIFTKGTGQEVTLGYSADCANGQGWRYDNRANPTKVELCPASCGAVQADGKGKMTVAFGCKTVSVIK
jgi:hypothetical protein